MFIFQPSVSLVLIKRKSTDDHGVINYRIKIPRPIPGGKRYIFKTSKLKINQSEWDADNQIIKKNNINARAHNADLTMGMDNIIETMKTANRNGAILTESYLVELLSHDKPRNGSFLTFFEEYIKQKATRTSKAYIKQLEVEYRCFKNFIKRDIQFSDINSKLLNQYEASLPVSRTTIHKKMKRIREVIKQAEKEELIKPSQTNGYQLPTYQAPERTYLTMPELEKIEEAIYTGQFDYDPLLLSVACYFMIECSVGIRFSDWKRFEVKTVWKSKLFTVTAQKNKQPISIEIEKFPKLNRVVNFINDNNIKFTITEQMTNRLLKHMAAVLRINKKLTTHIGRHTCATLLAEKGYNELDISEVLGISPNVAKTYIKSTRQRLKTTVDKLGGI